MSSVDRLIYTSSAEKGIPGVSGGLSGSKNGFWERLGRSKTVRGALAGLGMLGIGAKYDQPVPVDFPQEGVERAVESFDDRERREAVNFGSEMELEEPNELQRLRQQIDERLRELHPSETVSESRVVPSSTSELTSEQVTRVLGDGRLTVTIDSKGDNFTNATGRVLQEAVGTQLDGRGQWRVAVALLGDNDMTPDQVSLVHRGDQFELQVGEKTAEVLQSADLSLGEAALTKLAHDGQSDESGDAKVDYPETVQVEENPPPADPPVPSAPSPRPPDTPPAPPVNPEGGKPSTSSGSQPAMPAAPASQPVLPAAPVPQSVLPPAPQPQSPEVKPPVVKPLEKPGEEEWEAPPARVVPPPERMVIIPPEQVVPPTEGLAGADTIMFDREARGTFKVSPEKRVERLTIKRGESVISSGSVSEAPVRRARVFLNNVWYQANTAAVPLNGDFGQLDDSRFSIHSRVDRLEGDRKGPGVIERAVALKGVQAGDQVELTRSNGDVRILTVVSKSFDDPQNVGKGEGQVVISTCDPDNMPQNLNDTMRLVIVAQETAADDSGDNPAPIESGLPLAAVGAMLAARREEEKKRRKAFAKGLKSLLEEDIFSALGEVNS